jgi:secreted trypsin-like serine protease
MPLVKRGTTVDPVTCYTSGWSFTDLSNFPPNILQNIQIPFLCKSDEIARCVAAWAAKPDNITIDPATMLCAGFYQNPYKGPCNSERGTPLTCTDANTNTPVGIGILILANDCNGQEPYDNVPAIFTNIYKYLDFINAKIVETIGGPPPFPV